MKSYKDYPKQWIGSSDVASLWFCGEISTKEVHFGKDGDYSAYIIPDNVPIGDHYKLCTLATSTAYNTIKIVDEKGIAQTILTNVIGAHIYRAGEMGIIIKYIKADESKEVKVIDCVPLYEEDRYKTLILGLVHYDFEKHTSELEEIKRFRLTKDEDGTYHYSDNNFVFKYYPAGNLSLAAYDVVHYGIKINGFYMPFMSEIPSDRFKVIDYNPEDPEWENN